MGTFHCTTASKRSMKLTPSLLVALVAAVAAGCGQRATEPGPTAPQAEATPLPGVAQIECEVNGARVLTTRVRPQADGVHLEVRNDTGEELAFSAEESKTGGQGASAPPGSVDYVWPLAPGKISVKCTNDEADPSEIEGAIFEVVDEEGVWVSTSLADSCKEASMTTADYAMGAQGKEGDPVDIARRLFEKQGLGPGDVVESAGYPESDETIVRVTRAGDVIATMSFLRDGAGGWLPENTTVCTAPPAFD
jgi:hypothetical protein